MKNKRVWDSKSGKWVTIKNPLNPSKKVFHNGKWITLASYWKKQKK